eukprot:scaffold118695_cov63-Phaeocystis_antarctica.AAC.3
MRCGASSCTAHRRPCRRGAPCSSISPASHFPPPLLEEGGGDGGGPAEDGEDDPERGHGTAAPALELGVERLHGARVGARLG